MNAKNYKQKEHKSKFVFKWDISFILVISTVNSKFDYCKILLMSGFELRIPVSGNDDLPQPLEKFLPMRSLFTCVSV